MIQYLLAIALTVSFSKGEFFKTIDSKDKSTIVGLEKKLHNSTQNDDQKAYLGTVMMKAAEFESTAGDKLNKFKAGKAMLEEVIGRHSTNVEYRFLRLMIQEHAPKILKYNTHIKEDADFIKAHLDKVSSEVKTAIKNYAAVSPSLNL